MDAVIEKQTPRSVTKLGENLWFAEFERSCYARLEYIITVEDDCEVELAIGEVLTADGRLDREPGGYRIFRTDNLQLHKGVNRGFMFFKKHRSPYQDSYQRSKVLTPENTCGEIEPFRCVEISGPVSSMELIRHGCFGEFDENAADFVCNDDKLNTLWDFCKYSIKATSAFGLFIDGERERQCFEGDCYINALTAYCTGGSFRIARRTIDFLTNFYSIPAIEYRLLTPLLIRDYFLYSGDTAIYQYWRDELPGKFMPQFMADDGMYHYSENNYNIFPPEDVRNKWPYQYQPLFPDESQLLVDWPVGERDNYEFGKISFFPHNFLYAAYLTMEELEPNSGYKEKAVQTWNNIYKNFYRNGMFFDTVNSNHTAIHTAATAMAFNLVKPEDAHNFITLAQERGMAGSPYCGYFLLDGLFQYGGEKTALDFMRREDDRSWLGMLKMGATITTEAWNNFVKYNQCWNHAWGAGPAAIMVRRLAGIRPSSFGFKSFDVDPRPGDIKEFRVRQTVPQGIINMEYSSGKLDLQVPAGCTASCRGQNYIAGRHTIKLD